MNEDFNLSVYFVLDPSLCGGREILDVASSAIRGGVTMIQLRNKTGGADEVAEQARVLMTATHPSGVPLLINDHVEVARDIGADGVHLGQGDMSPEQAREMLGDIAIIGQTAFTEEHMGAIDPGIVDYVGTGPVYETKTDKGKPVLGLERFKELAALSPVPVVGIGGITPDNALAVVESGADGVAMMRAISEARDPEAAADMLLNRVAAARLRRAS